MIVAPVAFRRGVSVETWMVSMTIIRFEKQPVWLAILRLAEENRGSATIKKVHEDLLQGQLSERAASLLIKRVAEMGLLDSHHRLTLAGRNALRSDRVEIRERAQYELECVVDPLVPQRIVRVSEPIPPNLSKEDLRDKLDALRKIGAAERLPEHLEAIQGTTAAVNDGITTLRIESIEDRAMLKNKKRAVLSLAVTKDSGTSLSMEDASVLRLPVPESFKLDYEGALNVVTEILGERWIRDRQVALVGFDDCSAQERNTFRKMFRVERPRIQGFGEFDGMTTPELTIEPLDEENAQEWYEWLVLEDLPSLYQTVPDFAKHSQQNAKKLPERFRLHELDQASAARRLFEHGQRDKAWLLQAPLDIGWGG